MTYSFLAGVTDRGKVDANTAGGQGVLWTEVCSLLHSYVEAPAPNVMVFGDVLTGNQPHADTLTLISNLQPAELGEISFCYLSPRSMVFHMAARMDLGRWGRYIYFATY